MSKTNLEEWKNIWVFCEQRHGKLMDVSLELLGEGYKLSREIGEDCLVCAVLVGEDLEDLIDELYEYGADVVYYLNDAELEQYTTDGYTKVIAETVKEYKPEIFMFGATHIGRDLAPRIAARLDTGLTADCTRLDVDTGEYIKYLEENATINTEPLERYKDDKNLKQTRPAFGGNLMATILCPNTRPQMSTVRPGVMEKREKEAGRKGELVNVKVDIKADDIRVKVLEVVQEAKKTAQLTDAEIICSGGRGLGSQEGFKLIEKLAETVGGVVGASRAVVDAGWIDSSHQVGQTGTIVRPKIYFACGISGAIQHKVGMQNSDIIIAINKDEGAPIFEIADFSIVGDLEEVVPEIINQWNTLQIAK